MPYIHEEHRTTLLTEGGVCKPGELNFLFSEIINQYLRERGVSYQIINDVIGALEGAKLEFYRRIAVPYENRKLAQNGDVYTYGS